MTRRPLTRPVTRPVLAPGLTVRQRTSDELQIGLTDRHRLRVADTPAIRRTLAALLRGEAPRPGQETRHTLGVLAPALRDGDALLLPGIPASEAAAVSLLHPGSGRARLQARATSRIAVVGNLGGEGGGSAGTLLARSGLRTAAATEDADVVLVLADGPLDREVSDVLVRDDVPHLVVEAVESDLVVGPFVVPGRTACLRCLDAHRGAEDPLHPALLGTVPQIARHDGVAVPQSAAMATMALAWAVADLVRYVEGDHPTTWSATVTFTPGRSSIVPVHWNRHPACGCSWSAVAEPAARLSPSATMGP